MNPFGLSLAMDTFSVPGTNEAGHRLLASKSSFVHYSSAEAAFQIFRTHRVWVRKSSIMNDFSEVEHGRQCLLHAYNNTSAGGNFKSVIAAKFPDLLNEIERLFDEVVQTTFYDTYIIAISEHDRSEDVLGRLSMWRAYGRRSGVAIVLNPAAFSNFGHPNGVSLNAVVYKSMNDFESFFYEISVSLQRDMGLLSSNGRQWFLNYITHMLRSLVLCTKHPAFHEEREWRMIYSPMLDNAPAISQETVVVSGVPQRVCILPVRAAGDQSSNIPTFDELVSHVIVGPSAHPLIVREALVHVMTDIGMKEANSRVVVAGVPLRTHDG